MLGKIDVAAMSSLDRSERMDDVFDELNDLIAYGGYNQPEVAEKYWQLFGPEGLDSEAGERINGLLSLLPDQIELASGEKIGLQDCVALDLGSGPGIVTEKIEGRVKRVIAVDKSEAMVKFIVNHPDIFPPEKVEVKVGNFNDQIPLPDEAVEISIASGIVSEIPPTWEAEDHFLRELMRVIKPGGCAIVDGVYFIIPNENIPKYYDNMRYFYNQNRESEIRNASFKKEAEPQRRYVFLADELPERLRDLGFDCDVELMPGLKDRGWAGVKITLNKKLSNDHKA